MSWPLVKLKDVCTIVGGATPKRNVAEYWAKDVPWVTPKDISKIDMPTLADAPEYISDEGFKSCSAQMLPKNSILVTSRAPIGNIAITGREMCTNQGFKSLVPSSEVNANYLYHCMVFYSPKLQALGNGATFKEVSKKIVENFEIPLPPLDEQKRIAEILDKADGLRRKREKAIQLTDTLLRSVFLDMFGDPVSNNKRWPVKELADLIDGKNGLVDGPFGSAINTKVDYIDDGEIPVIRTKNVGRFEFKTNDLKFISRKKFSNIMRSKVIPGDIILTKVGTIGNVCIFPALFPEAVLSTTGSVRIRFKKEEIHTIYALHYLDLYKPEMMRMASAGVQAFLNLKHIKSFRVPTPPIELQREFAKKAEKIELLLEKSVHCSAINTQNFSSLTQRAFRGELVGEERV